MVTASIDSIRENGGGSKTPNLIAEPSFYRKSGSLGHYQVL